LTIAFCGCAHATQETSPTAALCNASRSEPLTFSSLAVLAYPDQHGDYLKISACSERTFAVEFSKSGLYTEQYADLLRLMRFNASHGGTPIEMTISGSYQIAEKDGASLSRVIVDRIIDYAPGQTIDPA